MRGAVAERKRADFDIPAPPPWVCSHICRADAGGSAISWGQRWFGARSFEADAENWVLDPFVVERILLPLRDLTNLKLDLHPPGVNELKIWASTVSTSDTWTGMLATTDVHLSLWDIWVRSRNCGCLVTWFCYQLIAKPGNKTATVLWPDPYASTKAEARSQFTGVDWQIVGLHYH